jgi:ABC-2 type transport system ATP-binding protein
VDTPLVSARDLGVQFSRNRRRHRSVRELIVKGRTGTRADEFWPFRNVSFDIYQGEAVGVVGRNGQGKSTLLSVIAGVLLPDEGTVDVRAGVAPLIALTGGFEGELSARENIGLVAGLHGMTDKEIRDSFDEIVDFAEIEDFLDTPFKHFSSGMKVRLAFSVVSRLREPIMLVDEVLAVGDAPFRRKCYDRIKWLLGEGQTLFFVSHSAAQLRQFCKRGLYLSGGELRADGPIEEIIQQYEYDVGVATQQDDDGSASDVFSLAAASDTDSYE